MKENQDYLNDISEIRSMMERSSRFISLSGLSGVFAGIYALIGAHIANDIMNPVNYDITEKLKTLTTSNLKLLMLDVTIVLVLAIATGIFFTVRRAKKANQKIWDRTVQRLLINLFIPLAAGGLFCLTMIFRGVIGFVAPATLIFYGLALINASRYTVSDIRSLGLAEIALGLIAASFPGYGLIFWAIGFGILHILYGAIMYFKYERISAT
ncbi:hypothetical protein QQ008_03690 [Fulvivirgaceae bacterium BMA10]|uniref:Uncharacterized protein n=1 Tax=Splendidivirga corallicola TaxID=3051826 RepID=A0ABT8KI97_9BACT|nr:hypothetical protein [Fulvivirgaceae bacterium BMA10]